MKNLIKTEIIKFCEICKKEKITLFCKTKDYSYKTCDNNFTYLKCNNCDVLFLKNRPFYKDYKKIYTNNYRAFGNSKFNLPFSLAKLLGNYLKVIKIKKLFKKKLNVFEVGPGDGQLIRLISFFKIAKSKNIYCLESDYETAQKLKKFGFNSKYGTFEKFQIKKKFDLIILNQVFEHFKNPISIIKKLERNLNKDGILLIETPTLDFYKSAKDKKKYWGGLHAPRHMYLYNKRSIKKIFKKSKFKIIGFKYIISPYLLYESFKAKLIGKKLFLISKVISIYNPIFLLNYILIEFYNLFLIKKVSNMQIILKKI